MRNVLLIAGRDLQSYVFGFIGYFIVAAVLFIDGVLFNAWAMGGTAEYSAEILRKFFYICSGTTMIAGVLLSMPTFAGERLRGTDTLLAHSPIQTWQMVLGKHLASMGVLSIMTLMTFYMPLLIMYNGKIAGAHVIAGYTGLLLLGSAVVAIGTFTSSFVPNHLVSAITSGVTVVLLLICWFLADITDPPFTDVIAAMSLFDKHFIPFQEGRIALSGFVYYASLTLLFLWLATKSLEREMAGPSGFFGFVYDLPVAVIGIVWLIGNFMLFMGQRVLAGIAMLSWPFTLLGLATMAGVVGWRVYEMGQTKDPGRKLALQTSVAGGAAGFVAFAIYLTTLPMFTDAIGLNEESAASWYVVATTLYLILWLVGTVPLVFVDRVLFKHPTVAPVQESRLAATSGVATALLFALLFPLNYLALNNNIEYDYAFTRTTRAGSSTLALVGTLTEPVQATLFFTAGNDVKEQVVPYMTSLADSSDGLFTYEVVDQAMVPERAEELKVRDNGYIALSMGENTEKFKIGTDIDRARRDLKKLDGTVQKHLLKLAKGQRTAYMLTGHGEASSREKDNPTRKLNIFKKLLQGQNYKVKDLGVSDGSADTIPEDAGLVVIAAPTRPLMPEEELAIQDYIDRGGRLMVLTDPMPRPLPGESPTAANGVLKLLGLTSNPNGALAHKTKYVPQKRGKYDRILLHSNRYGSHASVKTLSRNSSQLHVILPTVVGLSKLDEQPGKVTTLIRSHPDTWLDTDGDFEKGPEEESKVWDLAVAVEGGEGESEWRAVVVGDVSFLADNVLQFSQGNAQFALDTTRWLVGDEDIAGEVESEEDVKIQHTREDDVLWFWGTILVFPLFILVGGVAISLIRRRS